MEVHGVLEARSLGGLGSRHDEFHVVPRTTVLVKLEIGKEPPKAVEHPHFKWDPLRRRVIIEPNISQVEHTVPETVRMNL